MCIFAVMGKSKIYKFSAVVALLLLAAAAVAYQFLSNRHKAIVKTYVLQKTGLMDGDWNVAAGVKSYKMISPDFLIDGIYKSMEGPKASNYVQLSQDSTLLWITGFHVRALDAKTSQPISDDFICHTNVDFNDVNYFTNFGLKDRIGKQYPRMTSLSHGLEDFAFPAGYGVPMKGNDWLFVTTQSLNHNLPDIRQRIKHEVRIDYHDAKTASKPLMSRTVFIRLPYDKHDPFKEPLDPASNQCIPVETKNHSYDDGKGNMLSGHWVIPRGKHTYRSDINDQLQIKDSLRLHAAAIHVHPFATALTLFDKTSGKAIFTSKVTNHKDRVGLSDIGAFSSESGIWLYANHQYELVLETQNTTATDQDMMGSMFLFFYDAQLDAILTKRL